jgi:hypothetical protein
MGDQYRDDFPKRWPNIPLQPFTPLSPSQTPHAFEPIQDELKTCNVCGLKREAFVHAAFEPEPPLPVSRDEFNALKKEVEELKILLLAAKRFDEETGQKNCEVEEKVAFIRQLAEFVGVDVDDVFGKGVGEA